MVTLSWLLAQDLPQRQAYIFTERPSTFNHKAAFINDKKYVIHDYSPDMARDSRHLKAMRACPVAGSNFPILVTRDINPLIREVSYLVHLAAAKKRVQVLISKNNQSTWDLETPESAYWN